MSKPLEIRKSLPIRPKTDSSHLKKKMKQAAQLYEKQFLNEMVKAMRATVSYSDMTKPTMAETIYLDKMFDNYVDQWSQKGGVGLAQIIYKQLEEKFGGVKMKAIPPQLPIKIKDDKNPITIEKPSDGNKKIYQFQIPSGENASLVSPWPGLVTKLSKNSDWTGIEIQHNNGLTSKFSFRSIFKDDLTKVKSLTSGQTIVTPLASMEKVFWELNQSKS